MNAYISAILGNSSTKQCDRGITHTRMNEWKAKFLVPKAVPDKEVREIERKKYLRKLEACPY